MTDDKILVDQILAGDQNAFRRLINQYERLVAHMIYRIVDNSEDREEICQDVFVKVYHSLDKFNFKSKLSTWIATIAYRHGLNHLKKSGKVISSKGSFDPEGIGEQYFIDNKTPEKIFNQSETKEVIHKLVEKLPEQYKTVLTLFHLEEMSYPEIVEITGMPEGTVKNYLFRARKLLKEQLQHFLIKEVI